MISKNKLYYSHLKYKKYFPLFTPPLIYNWIEYKQGLYVFILPVAREYYNSQKFGIKFNYLCKFVKQTS